MSNEIIIALIVLGGTVITAIAGIVGYWYRGRVDARSKKTENKRTTIQRIRDNLDAIESSDLGPKYQDTADYSILKQVLTDDERTLFETPRGVLTFEPRPSGGGTGKSNKQVLLDAVNRLEKDWELI